MYKLSNFHLCKFTYGTTIAVITSLALIIGFEKNINPQITIISAMLIVALSDNIVDSLGIHMYQESMNIKQGRTISNFLTRFLVTISFIPLIAFLPINTAVIMSLIYGFILLGFISYCIAKNQKTNSISEIIKHFTITILVLVLSNFLGDLIRNIFK
jgi:VIT1/CCC1 family predicted Fe2+/Mn2+ transporter